MVEFNLGYREIIPDQTQPEKWKEITLNTGGSQSTLQDIKVPERAGGYSYNNTNKYYTRNRFIYWRISHDILELVEHSLDVNLVNSKVRYKFMNTPILDGISIHETINSVIILVATVASVHKLTFPHPNKIHKQEHLFGSYPDVAVQSVLGEASLQTTRDPHSFHVITTAGTTNSPIPHAAASWLTLPHEEAVFALAYNTGSILVLRLDTITGLVHSTELKQDSIVPRFLSGIAIALRGKNTEDQVAMSLEIHTFGINTYLFALCREGTLRMWSCNKSQCVAVADVTIDSHQGSQGIHGHMLKKVLNSTENEFYLGIYLKFSTGCEFSVFKPVPDAGLFKFIRICTLFAPDQHLVDFSFTMSRLWAAWRTTDMDTVTVTHAQLLLNSSQVGSEWETAILEPAPDRDYIISDLSTDPRQSYINYIFQPGKFSLVDITRALSIYRKSNLNTDMILSSSQLKERVCMAVEAEIQSEVMDYEMTDEDYLEIANRCWSKFYSCVIQYHINGNKPVGLLLLPNAYGVALLKKSSFSLLRPMEALEYLMLSNEQCYSYNFKTTPILSQDEETCQDLILLMSAIVLLENQLSEETKIEFKKELYYLKSPDTVIDDMLSKLSLETDDPLSDFNFQTEINHKLDNIKDASKSMAMLLEALTYNPGQPDKVIMDNNAIETSKIILNTTHLFSSQLGISTITESVAQIAFLRFSICRNLLILQRIILSRLENFDSKILHSIKSSLAPRTVVLTQAYYVVLWLRETTANTGSQSSFSEISIQRLSSLKLMEPRTTGYRTQQRSLSLLEHFVQSSGAKHAHKLLINSMDIDNSDLTPWHCGMLTQMTLISQVVWPASNNFVFPEWLLSSCQFLLVQEYVRLLSTWCEWNSASRKFILAVALLEMGETRKACDHFLRASSGILTDNFLATILVESSTSNENHALVLYYLKIIELFEQHKASDCIIELAYTAITVSDRDDPNLPTLHSIVFTQHLNLGHYREAYHCLNSNPDNERKSDCLRQLVVTLFEKKKLIDLISFPYVDMYELEKIVIGRARSVDLIENNYYNFLYSFHVNNKNLRKAASVMYEQAMRLSQESSSIESLTKESQCLLACINSLNLVSEKYRWIVRPVVDEAYSNEEKKSIGGEEVLHYEAKKTIEIFELKDIKKEYYLVNARLKLSKHNSKLHTVAQAGPAEIIAVLTSVGLYITALHICDEFNISKCSVLEGLTSQCLRLTKQEDLNAWDWLIQNNIFDLVNCSYNSVVDVCWSLLKTLTLLHEKKNESKLHKCIASKLLQQGAFLPQWLIVSYKKTNPSELLRIILNSGRLLEALDLTLDYINAILGEGKEYFGLDTPLIATGPPVWLPLNTIELLLLELKNASDVDYTYIEAYTKLKNTLDDYVHTVKRVSEDMVRFKMQKSETY